MKQNEKDQDRTLRSQSVHYDRELCIICQRPGGICRTVEFLETGWSMLHVAEKLENKSFFLRLNTIPNASDAVANDVKYHLLCWSNCKRNASKIEEDAEIVNNEENIAEVISFPTFN